MLDPQSKVYISFRITNGNKAAFEHIATKLNRSPTEISAALAAAFVEKHRHLLEDFDLMSAMAEAERKKERRPGRRPNF